MLFLIVQQWVLFMKNIKMKMAFCTLPTVEKTPLECDDECFSSVIYLYIVFALLQFITLLEIVR